MCRKHSLPLILVAIIILAGGCASPRQQGLSTATATQPAGAATVVEIHSSLRGMTLTDLILEADLIAIGQVEAIQPARWTTEDGDFPTEPWLTSLSDALSEYTLYRLMEFRVEQVLKGLATPGEVVRARLFGGQWGDIVLKYVDTMVAFEAGPTYLLFLRAGGDYPFCLFHVSRGQYFIRGTAFQGTFVVLDGERVKRTPVLDENGALVEHGVALYLHEWEGRKSSPASSPWPRWWTIFAPWHLQHPRQPRHPTLMSGWR